MEDLFSTNLRLRAGRNTKQVRTVILRTNAAVEARYHQSGSDNIHVQTDMRIDTTVHIL